VGKIKEGGRFTKKEDLKTSSEPKEKSRVEKTLSWKNKMPRVRY